MSEPTTTPGGSAPNMGAGAAPAPPDEIAGGPQRSTLARTKRTIARSANGLAADEVQHVALPGLAELLAGALSCELADPPDYDQRNRFVLLALGVATAAGVPAGIRIDVNEPEWPVVYFQLEEGQVSWHLPQHEQPWDGHSTELKNERVDAFLKRVEESRG